MNPSAHARLIQAAIFALAIGAGPASMASGSDGIALEVSRGVTPHDVVLNWTGGLGPFQISRSHRPDNVLAHGRELTETAQRVFTDESPAALGILFYLVTPRCPLGHCPLTEPPYAAPGEPGSPVVPRLLPEEWGKSVSLYSGEFSEEAEDLRISGRGLDFVWTRRYRSRSEGLTVLGHGWDFSYNIRILTEGPDLRLFDGNGRSDLYLLQRDGSWGRREFFRVLRLQEDGSYAMIFPDTGRWNFLPLDGTARAGRIDSIVDRNGNRLSFEYDPAGRLTAVTDTLDRVITLQYAASGFLDSVTDFAGRQVRYSYYGAGETGGSPGDLRSVTGPAVTGTPNGNDFPTGKTTVYTYSHDAADERLNHNLLTITDARGATFLRNTYSTAADPADQLFDRVVRQAWGSPGDLIDFHYAAQAPAPENGFAVVKTIVNDRVGNVGEYLYDGRNRLVGTLEYTGRADPAQPTTETTNRPAGRLRPEDPEAFVTRFEYNDDSLVTRVQHPNGNTVARTYEFDLEPGAPRRSRGNLREIRRLPGPPGGDQAEIAESFEYDPAVNLPIKRQDGRGNETLHLYDARGNLLRTRHRIPSIVEDFEYNAFGQMTARILPDGGGSRRRDEFLYHELGPQRGYLHRSIVDQGGFALAASYEYDALGRIVRTIDPAGNDNLLTVNALGQVVRELSREVATPSGPRRYKRDYFYDANDNLVRLDVQNVDDAGNVVAANPEWTTLYEHDILNRLTRATREVDAGRDVITEVAYDANGNAILFRSGEATRGSDPFNTISFLHDERDRPYRRIRAAGAAEQSTLQYDYDGNGNLIRNRAGIEDGPRVTAYAYDGYDRLVLVTDPMGNTVEYRYDANGNLGGDRSPGVPNPFASRTMGELIDVPGAVGNVRLAEVMYTYDPMDRRTREDAAFFDALTQAPIGDGASTRQFEYTGTSRIRSETDDNGHVALYAYDTAGRMLSRTDARGNISTYSYDPNSRAVGRLELERSDTGRPDETFTSAWQYDAAGRLVAVTGSAGELEQYRHDSRGRVTTRIDPSGNATGYEYDGLGRLVRVLRDMDGNGLYTDPADIVTAQEWDDASRLVARTDANGHRTRFAYDALDRPIVTQMADGTLRQVGRGATWPLGAPRPDLVAFVRGYDAHDDSVATTDANGSIVQATYDGLGRSISRAIVPGPGVAADTTFELYRYDGLSRLVHAEDDDSRVTRTHDSLSNLTAETQRILPSGPSRVVTAAYDGAGNQTRLVYGGGREIQRTYDAINRPLMLTDNPPGASPLASYAYGGAQRVERCDFGNGTSLDVTYDAGRRPVRTRHTRLGDGQVLGDRQYRWDAAHNKTEWRSRQNPFPLERCDYEYDAANRLTSSSELFTSISYQLDHSGNRTLVAGGPDAGPYTCDAALPEPADCQVGQYTTTPRGLRRYDANGNMILAGDAPGDALRYDYRDQLVRVDLGGSGSFAAYRYDALGRRIERNVDGNLTRHLYAGGREIEEEDAAGTTRATYVWGQAGSGLVQMRRGGVDYFYHADDLGSVLEVTGPGGAVAERVRYDDYGRARFFDPSGGPRPASGIGNVHLFASMRLDSETGFLFQDDVPPVTASAFDRKTGLVDTHAGRHLQRAAAGAFPEIPPSVAIPASGGRTYVQDPPSRAAAPGSVENPHAYAGTNPASQRTGRLRWPVPVPYDEYPFAPSAVELPEWNIDPSRWTSDLWIPPKSLLDPIDVLAQPTPYIPSTLLYGNTPDSPLRVAFSNDFGHFPSDFGTVKRVVALDFGRLSAMESTSGPRPRRLTRAVCWVQECLCSDSNGAGFTVPAPGPHPRTYRSSTTCDDCIQAKSNCTKQLWAVCDTVCKERGGKRGTSWVWDYENRGAFGSWDCFDLGPC